MHCPVNDDGSDDDDDREGEKTQNENIIVAFDAVKTNQLLCKLCIMYRSIEHMCNVELMPLRVTSNIC